MSEESEPTLQKFEEGTRLALEFAHEMGSFYADDHLAIQALCEGMTLFAEQQRVPPWLVAEEFLVRFREWIRERDEQEAALQAAILKASREAKA